MTLYQIKWTFLVSEFCKPWPISKFTGCYNTFMLHKKWSFPLRISSVNMIPADLVTQTEEIFDQKLFFFAVISVITVLSFILESMKLIPFYVIYGPENWFFGECITDNNMKFYQVTHCVKYVRIRSFSCPFFSH